MYKKDSFTFRNIAEKDLNLIRCWRNHKYIRSSMLTDHIISEEEHQKWFLNIVGNSQCFYQIVVYRNVDIGLSYITEINQKSKTCLWGFYLGDPFARPGIGAAIEYLSLDYIFENLQMRKVWLEILISNQQVLSMNKSFGFHEEGRLRAHVRKGEEYEDVIILSLFRSEWVKNKHKYEKLLFIKK